MKNTCTSCIVLLAALIFTLGVSIAEEFDVRQHLSTVSSYGAVIDVSNDAAVVSTVRDGCSVIHLNLVARHGTRAPTKKRIKELDRLALRLEALLSDAKNARDRNLTLETIPGWLWGWRSPWKGKQKGGELLGKGEEELYGLGIRMRDRFPELFNEEYHPDIFVIKATQVPRASASAVAFGMGLFSRKGSLGPGQNRAFSVISESRASDIFLRFHDTCETYKEYRKSQEPAVEKLKEPVFTEVASALKGRYQLNFTGQDISSLWFLCKQEASLLDKTDQACGLFIPLEVELLEWTDDLESFILKGYGNSINYRMGVPLLKDVFQAMEQAIVAREERQDPGTFERSRLRFAHAETVLPFTCLLGLFLEGSDFEKLQKEQPLQPPPKPPSKRNWRGGIVAPFAGNNMLALYQCPSSNSGGAVPSGGYKNEYFVQVLHNEIPVKMPGCDNADFCPFKVFKEKIVDPHLKYDFNLICNTKLEAQEPCSFTTKFFSIFQWLFLRQNNDNSHSHKTKAEL